MTTESPQFQRIRSARAGLLLTHPFFGVLSLKVDIRETREIPTAGVTTAYLLFNPDYVDTLSSGELKGLIAHEVMHLALGHHARVGNRNHKLFNIAADFAENQMLVDDSMILPPGALIDPQYKGLNAEQIYERLRDECKNNGFDPENPDSMKGQGWGEFEAAGHADSAEANEAARQWAENAAEAYRAAKAAGKLPANLAREITEILKPRADWRSILRRFMTDQMKRETTWSTPNKRFYPRAYIPGVRRDATMGPIAIGVDTSGSISGEMLNKFAAEITSIVNDVSPSAVHVVYCDAQVNAVESFEPGDDVVLRPNGGGGTMFTPVFERIAKEEWSPACCVYLTDLCCSDFPPEQSFPTLWATYGAGDAVAPMGETVRVE